MAPGPSAHYENFGIHAGRMPRVSKGVHYRIGSPVATEELLPTVTQRA